MARIATVTWRGQFGDPGLYYTADYGGIKRVQTLSAPACFDNPVAQNEENLGIHIPFSSLTEGRIGVRFKNLDGSADKTRLLALYEGATTQRVTLYRGVSDWGKLLYTYYPGAAYVYQSLHLNMEINSLYDQSHVVEVYWKCDGSSSIVRIYLNGILVIEHNPCNIGTAGINRLLLGSITTSYAMSNQFEWAIVEDADTELCWQKFARLRPNGAGNSTQLTPKPSGTNYQLVDEAIADAADYNLADAADEKDTYACEDPSDVNSITALRVCGVAAQQGEGDLEVKPVVRTGGADYEGNAQAIGNVHTLFAHRWATNPDTAAAWQTSEISAMEIGMKAVSP